MAKEATEETTEKNKGGRPKGAVTKSKINRTKLLREAIATNFDYDFIIREMKLEFMKEGTSLKDKIAILNLIMPYDVFTRKEALVVESEIEVDGVKVEVKDILDKLAG